MIVTSQILNLVDSESDDTCIFVNRIGLETLVRVFLEKHPIDEDAYLATYDDVKVAVENGEVISATEHFLQFGLFEHRVALPTNFNEKAYLNANPDLAMFVNTGAISDLRLHYAKHGYAEGRPIL